MVKSKSRTDQNTNKFQDFELFQPLFVIMINAFLKPVMAFKDNSLIIHLKITDYLFK